MATTNVDFSTVTAINYNDGTNNTSLTQLWWCDTSNATCCMLWPNMNDYDFYMTGTICSQYRQVECRGEWFTVTNTTPIVEDFSDDVICAYYAYCRQSGYQYIEVRSDQKAELPVCMKIDFAYCSCPETTTFSLCNCMYVYSCVAVCSGSDGTYLMLVNQGRKGVSSVNPNIQITEPVSCCFGVFHSDYYDWYNASKDVPYDASNCFMACRLLFSVAYTPRFTLNFNGRCDSCDVCFLTVRPAISFCAYKYKGSRGLHVCCSF